MVRIEAREEKRERFDVVRARLGRAMGMLVVADKRIAPRREWLRRFEGKGRKNLRMGVQEAHRMVKESYAELLTLQEELGLLGSGKE